MKKISPVSWFRRMFISSNSKESPLFTNTFFLIATLLVVVFTISFGIYEYKREHAFRVDILHAQLQLNNYTRRDSLIRVTVIDTFGKVTFDSHEKNIKDMGNHLERKEVKEALLYGSGFDIKRTSNINGEEYFYSATYFPERAEVVRSSVPYSAPLTASLARDYTFFYYTAGILALVAIVLYFRYLWAHSEDEKQRIKRQLTENAAHELKTPAATINGYLETLVDNPTMSPEKRNEFIERCYAQSKRMTRLLTDMSTLTQLDEANISRPETRIDAALIIRQIVEETKTQFEEKNIEVRLSSLPKSLPMQGDSSLTYSLFRNIFSNALAYAVDATYFEILTKVSGNNCTFYFIDNGVGVSEEHLPHLFERFYRTDKGRSRRLGGTGLGLAIVKNIAVRYGGCASAYNTVGGGLTIQIEIELTRLASSI